VSTALPFAAVVRLSGIRFSQPELEALLEVPVERYSRDDEGYAQIAIEGGERGWQTIDAFLGKYGPALKGLRDSRGIGSLCLDLAYEFDEGLASMSRTIPSQTAVLAGTHGVDVVFSVYVSSP
jgi:hypothetical protein